MFFLWQSPLFTWCWGWEVASLSQVWGFWLQSTTVTRWFAESKLKAFIEMQSCMFTITLLLFVPRISKIRANSCKKNIFVLFKWSVFEHFYIFFSIGAMLVFTREQPTAAKGNVDTPTTSDPRRSWSKLLLYPCSVNKEISQCTEQPSCYQSFHSIGLLYSEVTLFVIGLPLKYNCYGQEWLYIYL